MISRILVKSKITFRNPYVLSLDCTEMDSFGFSKNDYLKPKHVLKYLEKNATGTWGYSESKWVNAHLLVFFCFSNSQDPLYLKLAFDYDFKTLKVWPKVDFTIYEMKNDNFVDHHTSKINNY